MVILTEEELANDAQEPPERCVDNDWLYRWKENASKVSIENLQQIWGKVLAGEIKSPGTYSLRTLEFLMNISQEEAHLIEKVAQFNISGFIARNEDETFEENNLSCSSFIKLQELGIVNGVEALGVKCIYTSSITDSFQKVFISNGRALLVTHTDATKKLEICIYGVSDLGKQVLSLGSFSHNENYLTSVAKKIVAEGFEVKLGVWKEINETEGEISNQVIIEADKNV